MSRWTKKRPHISLGFIKTDLEAKVGVDNKIFEPHNRSFSRDRNRNRGNYNYNNRNNRPNYRDRSRDDYRHVITEEIPTGPMRDAITTDRTIGGDITIGKTI